jgi:predicted PurR-regulated permease PerM
VLVPVTFALMLALTLRPIVRQLKRRGMPVPLASATVITLVIAVFLTGVTYLVGPAKDWIDNAPQDLKTVSQRLSPIWSQWKQIQETSEELENLGETTSKAEAPPPVEDGVADGIAGRPHDQVDVAATTLQGTERRSEPVEVEVRQPRLESNLIILSSAGSFLTEAVVALVLTFFLLTSSDVLINNVLRMLPTMRDKRKIVELVYNVEQGISSYLLTVTCINIGLGFVEAVAMWLLGMPNPALWGAVCCVLNFIPYLGAMIGSIIVFLVAVLTFDKLGYAALVPIVYFAINAIEGNVVTPAILGKSMQLNPVIVFLFLTFWGWMWGIPGAILAVPILAVLKIGFDQFERTRPIATLLTG